MASDWQSSALYPMMMMFPQYQTAFAMKGAAPDQVQQAGLQRPPMEEPPMTQPAQGQPGGQGMMGGGLLGPSQRPNPRQMSMMQRGMGMMQPPAAPQQQGGGQMGQRRPPMSPQQAMMPFPYPYGRGY